MASVQLPYLASPELTRESDVSGKSTKVGSANLNQAKSFLSQLKLGSLRKQKRPGDVWRLESGHTSVAKQPRPLGLIPERQLHYNYLRDLSTVLPPLAANTTRDSQIKDLNAPESESEAGVVDIKSNSPQSMFTGEQISATVRHTKSKVQSSSQEDASIPYLHAVVLNRAPPPPSRVLETERPFNNYRSSYKQHGSDEPLQAMLPREPDQTEDLDYLDTLAKCNLGAYYSLPQTHNRRRAHTLPPPHTSTGFKSETPRMMKRSARTEWSRSRSNTIQFVSFAGQSQLWNRLLTDDRRDALGYEPCERCRERGGRCARCKVLRVGGGYIILDGENLSEGEPRNRFGNRYTLGSGHKFSRRSKGDRRPRLSPSEAGRDEGDISSHGWGGGDDSGSGKQRRSGDEGGAGQGRSGLDNADMFSAKKGGSGDGRLSSDLNRGLVGDEDWENKKRRGHRSDPHEGGRDLSQGDSYSPDQDRQKISKSSVGVVEDGRDSAGGRDSSRGVSRMSGSRPGSTRPMSSIRRRSGRPDSRHQGRLTTDRQGGIDVGSGRGRGKGMNERTSKDEEEDGWSKRQRGRGSADEVPDDGGSNNDRLKFRSSRDDDEPRPASGYYGNLMRFKRKTDDMKALHATLTELQTIDPLDYLARYCIIDQKKLPHYRHCYDNVDRDEDDEINITELDFALKAVNFDLISDTEMYYVHSVLELAGRYKLNFQLFSLIAALSEKVVALDDMVKRLVNKMDFGALEVKMKKCKELFYLLADSESNSQHEGGVVTTSSLFIELQAGGLTHEHVDFVVDRLNYEEKGLVEFLDYLTYVPLFVEIHESISGNPLDFSRNR